MHGLRPPACETATVIILLDPVGAMALAAAAGDVRGFSGGEDSA